MNTCSGCEYWNVWQRWTGERFVQAPCPIYSAADSRFSGINDTTRLTPDTFYCACHQAKQQNQEGGE